MADPSPRDPAKREAKPPLVAVEGDARPPRETRQAPGGATAPAASRARRSRSGLLLLLCLVLAAAAVAALVQTQRLVSEQARTTALAEQVIGLEAQLAAAHTQIATYEMQRGRIREAVSDLSQRVLLLGELVADDTAPPEPAPAP